MAFSLQNDRTLNVLFCVLFGDRLLILLLAYALRTQGVVPEILCWRMDDDTGIICRTIDARQDAVWQTAQLPRIYKSGEKKTGTPPNPLSEGEKGARREEDRKGNEKDTPWGVLLCVEERLFSFKGRLFSFIRYQSEA